jgi:hypothetical protein
MFSFVHSIWLLVMEERADGGRDKKQHLYSKLALNKFHNRLIEQEDVNALGIGTRRVKGKATGEICLKAFVPKKLPEKRLPGWKLLPKYLHVGGQQVMVDIEEMDKAVVPNMDMGLYAGTLPLPSFMTVRPGQSSANVATDVGTICVYAKRKTDPGTYRRFFLSCNHVFSSLNLAPYGTPIIAPARLDGGLYPYNEVGRLADFIPIMFGPLYGNFCDAAVAHTVLETGGTNTITDIGLISELGSISSIEANPQVRKIGRSSGVTQGIVVAAHASIKVDYWAMGAYGANTVFHDQIITSLMGTYGDSGSLLINHQQQAIGMLFAGSATHTFFNPLSIILRLFNMEI